MIFQRAIDSDRNFTLNQPVSLHSVRIVLLQTSHPGNLGAVARAMKVMGLRDLVLVEPKCAIDDEARIRPILTELKAIVLEGLITLQEVEVV